MNDNFDMKIIKNYEMIKKVGKGAYGQVYRCYNKKTRSVCALKRIFDAFRNSTDCQRTYREIMYLKELDHGNIVKLFSFEKSLNDKDMYIEMEYVESDLSTALKNAYLKDVQREYIFTQVVSAVYYLHSGDLLHRDIKPSNILIGANCEAKICDFGLIRSISKINNLLLHFSSKKAEERDAINENDINLTDKIATRWYKAPELLLSSCRYGKEVDVWSLGCLLAELYLGKPIFQGSSTFNQLEKIIEVCGGPNIEEFSQILQSETSIAILKSVCSYHPETENKSTTFTKKDSFNSISSQTAISKSVPSLHSLKESQYNKLMDIIPRLKENENETNANILDLLMKILQFDPRKRIKIEEILEHPYLSRFKNKVEFKKLDPSICNLVKYDNVKLKVDDYKLLFSNQKDTEIDLGGYFQNRKTNSPEKSVPGNNSIRFIPKNVYKNNDCALTETKKFAESAENRLDINEKAVSEHSVSKSSGTYQNNKAFIKSFTFSDNYSPKQSSTGIGQKKENHKYPFASYRQANFQSYQVTELQLSSNFSTKISQNIQTTYISTSSQNENVSCSSSMYKSGTYDQSNRINKRESQIKVERSISGNKSENKSVSGVSNRSYKSNLSKYGQKNDSSGVSLIQGSASKSYKAINNGISSFEKSQENGRNEEKEKKSKSPQNSKYLSTRFKSRSGSQISRNSAINCPPKEKYFPVKTNNDQITNNGFSKRESIENKPIKANRIEPNPRKINSEVLNFAKIQESQNIHIQTPEFKISRTEKPHYQSEHEKEAEEVMSLRSHANSTIKTSEIETSTSMTGEQSQFVGSFCVPGIRTSECFQERSGLEMKNRFSNMFPVATGGYEQGVETSIFGQMNPKINFQKNNIPIRTNPQITQQFSPFPCTVPFYQNCHLKMFQNCPVNPRNNFGGK